MLDSVFDKDGRLHASSWPIRPTPHFFSSTNCTFAYMEAIVVDKGLLHCLWCKILANCMVAIMAMTILGTRWFKPGASMVSDNTRSMAWHDDTCASQLCIPSCTRTRCVILKHSHLIRLFGSPTAMGSNSLGVWDHAFACV